MAGSDRRGIASHHIACVKPIDGCSSVSSAAVLQCASVVGRVTSSVTAVRLSPWKICSRTCRACRTQAFTASGSFRELQAALGTNSPSPPLSRRAPPLPWATRPLLAARLVSLGAPATQDLNDQTASHRGAETTPKPAWFGRLHGQLMGFPWSFHGLFVVSTWPLYGAPNSSASYVASLCQASAKPLPSLSKFLLTIADQGTCAGVVGNFPAGFDSLLPFGCYIPRL